MKNECIGGFPMNLFRQPYLWVLGGDPQRLSRVVLLTFAVAICLISPAKAGVEGDVELLKLTAMAHKDNRERICTWQGYVEIEQTYKDVNGVMLQQKAGTPFLLDRKQDAIRWKWIPEQRLARKQGQLVPDGEWLETVSSMTKDDAFYNYSHAITTVMGQKLNTLVIWPRAKARRYSTAECFNPMWYLTGHMTKCTDDLAERLMFFYRQAKNPNFSDVSVTRDGNLVILEVGDEILLNHHEFDLSKGGNIVKYYAKSEKGTELRRWTYGQKDGVWVPKTFVFEHRLNSPRRDGITARIRKVTFVEHTLNRPIPASEFSLEKLGVKVGDRVTDRIMGLSYVYGGSEKFPLEDEDLFLKETKAIQAKPSVKSAMETEEKQLTDKQGISDNVIAKQTTVGQVTQTERPGHTKYFVVALVAFGIAALVSFMLLRKTQKARVKA